jgi:hypothetical protein
LAACFGWTFEHSRQHVDIPSLEAINAYHRDSPPLHLLARQMAGYEPPKAAIAPGGDPPEPDEALIASLPKTVMTGTHRASLMALQALKGAPPDGG